MKPNIICLLLSLVIPLHATTVVPAFEGTFYRFRDTVPSRCDALLKDIKKKMPQPWTVELDTPGMFLANIRADILLLEGILKKPINKEEFESSVHSLIRNLVGFRRYLDQALIEAAAKNTFRIDKDLLEALREFWMDEENLGYYLTRGWPTERSK